MIARILGTLVIAALLAIAIALPSIPGMQRGSEARVRLDAPRAVGRVGETLPDFALPTLGGEVVRLSDFRGRRVLLTFERSVDW